MQCKDIIANNNINIIILIKYMSLYILPENQTLIWNTIMKTSHFQKKPEKQEWFRSVIQQFYDKSDPNMNVQQLRTLNKETVQYMIHTLKKDQESSLQYHGFSSNLSLESNNMESRDFLIEQKQTKINNQFENRQQEYGTMLQRPQVKDIDFTEKKADDTPLENIDSLLQKQMKEREYEIQPKHDLKGDKISTESMPNSESIDLNIQPLEEIGKTPKQVSWAKESEQFVSKEIFTKLEKQVEDFMKFVKDEIIFLKEEIEELKQQIQRKHIEEESTEKMKNIMSKLKKLEKSSPNLSSLDKDFSASS